MHSVTVIELVGRLLGRELEAGRAWRRRGDDGSAAWKAVAADAKPRMRDRVLKSRAAML